MGRFHLRQHDVDGDTALLPDDPMESKALVEYTREEESQPVAHFQNDDENKAVLMEATAYIEARRPDGTIFRVPYYPTQERKSPRTSWRFRIVLIAILTQLVCWYGPPAPPQSDAAESWMEFFERETMAWGKATLALASVIPHVSKWCWRSIQADMAEILKAAPCPLQVPDDLSFLLEAPMVGQSRAVAVATQALQAWQNSASVLQGDTPKALILVLAGTIGVGKLRLAQQIAYTVTCPAVVLQLQGKTYEDSLPHEFAEQLLQYTMGGELKRVVILQHPEDMASLLLTRALERLASIPNLIVILTTHVGSRIIHDHMKQQHLQEAGGQPSSSLLDRALRHELDTELDPGVSDYITAIAPFVPLGQEDLKQIMIQRVSDSLVDTEITPALAQEWTSEKHVEYFEWQSQGQMIATISSQGAKVLDETIWPALLAQQRRCQSTTAGRTMMEFDWDAEGEAVVSSCEEGVCEEECRFSL